MNNATNMGLQIPLQDPAFSSVGYMPGTVLRGIYDQLSHTQEVVKGQKLETFKEAFEGLRRVVGRRGGRGRSKLSAILKGCLQVGGTDLGSCKWQTQLNRWRL